MYYESQQINLKKKSVTGRRVSCYVKLQNNDKPQSEANRERQMAKGIVNIRLRPDQEERINAIVERSAILDTSKFVRIAVDWLLRSDIGEVIKTIVDDEAAFPDYAIPKTTGPKNKARSKRTKKA
jgi:hypothetical protein